MSRSMREWPVRRGAIFGLFWLSAGAAASCGGSPETVDGPAGESAGGSGGAGDLPAGIGGTSPSGGGMTDGVIGGEAVGGSPSLSGGSGAAPVGAGAASAVNPPPVDGRPVCARYPARSDGLLLDFDTYDVLDGSWGEPSLGQLTGGTSGYSCADDGVSCPVSAVIARVRTGGGGLRVQAAVPARGYTGMVLWFGPCVDASAFGALELQVSGELFGAVLSVKLQTHENYPIDLVNVKGGCEYTSEATKWSECVPPAFELSSATSEPSQLRLAWTDFTSGLPNPGVAPDGIVGIELAFQCPSDVDCAMDLRIGELRLTAP